MQDRFDYSSNSLIPRHIGPNRRDQQEMLEAIGYDSLEQLVKTTIPESIFDNSPLGIGEALEESEALAYLKDIAAKNQVFRSYIGQGYYNCITPSVIQRNILENPGWYTQYTPYQAEIAQGRMEALLNFQTMITDLTGLQIANASLLDEGTALAEAMSLSKAATGKNKNKYFIDRLCHPQSIEVVRTRAEAIGIELVVGDINEVELTEDFFGGAMQYPNTRGEILDPSAWIEQLHKVGALACMATDPLALCLLKSPGEWGADIAIGSTQRFGLGLFYGGPHAAFIATSDKYKRLIPGRIIGVTRDAQGEPALRLALQTREQHIRRDKATSNICTAQVLLAVVAGMYAVYHGPQGLRKIASRVHQQTLLLQKLLQSNGYTCSTQFFDTLWVESSTIENIMAAAKARKINLRQLDNHKLCLSLDESVRLADLVDLAEAFGISDAEEKLTGLMPADEEWAIAPQWQRQTSYLQHPNFNSYQTESEFLRYVTHLQSKDLSLAHSMIPLGSCTMKLNATSEMLPISWPEFASIHPFAPLEQTQGYQQLFRELESMLEKVTGFDAVSLQPNAGSQGEFAGLMAIASYHKDRGQGHRNICLIPTSAHGTNPASAVMAGMQVVPVACDSHGNIDFADLKSKAEQHQKNLAALMITYPSTHGVFEKDIREICECIHQFGGQVYMDGANMNAQVGLCRPGHYGADVCHLNLHKTFAIPHGGGGPGMGPIGVKAHLKDFLPGSQSLGVGPTKSMGAISAAPWGSALILNISWAYIKMLGDTGLRQASEISILNANYLAKRLGPYYPILFTDDNSLVAHECIIDCRPFAESAGVTVADIAKRLMDYGYHSPTMSWPVAGTMMIEPTESESKAELDRFCAAMIAIHGEIQEIASQRLDRDNNPLKNAPHTAAVLSADEWQRPYSRQQAAYPIAYLKQRKFWPSVSRVDDAYGDRNLVCTCPSMEEYQA